MVNLKIGLYGYAESPSYGIFTTKDTKFTKGLKSFYLNAGLCFLRPLRGE